MIKSMPKNSYPEACHSSKEKKTVKMLSFILLGTYYNA